MYLHATASRTAYKYDQKGLPLHYVGPFQRFDELQYERNYMDVETDCQVGYWRKFNALHQYIVDKFAKGEDDCQRIYLSREDIVQILDLLKKITPDNAMELLPPAQGFFFGSQEINEWYMQDVEYSIKVLQLALDFLDEAIIPATEEQGAKLNPDNPFKEYKYRQIYYRASW